MMDNWVPGLISGAGALALALVVGWLQSRRERHAQDHATASPEAPTTQQVWERQDRFEKVLRSALVLLGAVAEQEHVDTSQLPKKHLKVLYDANYLPVEWEHLVEDSTPNK